MIHVFVLHTNVHYLDLKLILVWILGTSELQRCQLTDRYVFFLLTLYSETKRWDKHTDTNNHLYLHIFTYVL